jgi:uncharacterized phage infection (PIP) family protein YhgE
MAFDASIEFGVFGETNADEVLNAVARAGQNAAEGTSKAAAGAEAMEKSMDSASGAVASLAGASEEADDELEQVENELEDIVTDAGAAAGSVQVLNSSLMAVEDIDDLDLDVDTNIEEVDAAC